MPSDKLVQIPGRSYIYNVAPEPYVVIPKWLAKVLKLFRIKVYEQNK